MEGRVKCGMKLSPHFTLAEMCKSQLASRRGIANQPDAAAIDAMRRLCDAVLEPLRGHFGVPIIPSSGYRSSALNHALRASLNSQHCKREAVDFEIAGITQSQIARWIVQELAFDQFIIEYPQADNVSAGWLHISYCEGRNRTEILTKTRSGHSPGFPPFW